MLFAFSLTRAVHPEFLPKQKAKEFMKHEKRPCQEDKFVSRAKFCDRSEVLQ